MRTLSTPLRAGALIGVLALAPLILAPGVLFYYDVTPKVLVALGGTAIALAAGGAVMRAEGRELRRLRVLLAVQAVSLTVSTLFSADPTLSVTGTGWRRFGLVAQLALLLYTALLPCVKVSHLLRAVAASGSLAAALGIAQYFGWDPWNPKQGYFIGEGVWTIVRPPGSLGHADYFGVYLVYVIFSGVALAWGEAERGEEARAWRWIGRGAAAAGAAALLLTGSRGAMLGLAAGAAALAVRRRPRITLRRAALAGALLAGLAGFYFSPAGVLLRARTRWYREDPGGGGRLTLWGDTLRMAGSRWLAGYGPETFSSRFPRFESEGLAKEFPDRYYESPHNLFLDALAGQGVPGLLALALLAALALRAARGAGARAEALAAGFAGALIAGQFVSFTLPTALLFYATAATLCALPARATQPAAVPGLVRWPAALLLVSAAAWLGWSDWQLARTSRALDAGRVEEGMDRYQRLRRFQPPGFDTDLWYSRALLAAAPKMRPEVAARRAWQEAFAAAQRAAAGSEQRANAYYNLAAFYALQNDFPHTEESLRAAMEWAPRWYKPRWMVAQLLQRAGRLNEAAVEARRAAELNAGKNAEVIDTWEHIRALTAQHR